MTAACIEEMSVSSHHARIVYGLGGYTLTDLGSTNGSRVDRTRLVRLATDASA